MRFDQHDIVYFFQIHASKVLALVVTVLLAGVCIFDVMLVRDPVLQADLEKFKHQSRERTIFPPEDCRIVLDEGGTLSELVFFTPTDRKKTYTFWFRKYGLAVLNFITMPDGSWLPTDGKSLVSRYVYVPESECWLIHNEQNVLDGKGNIIRSEVVSSNY